MGRTKTGRIDFGIWEPPPEPAPVPLHTRIEFAGLEPPEIAAQFTRIMELRCREAGRPLRPVTLRNKRDKLQIVLRDLAKRGQHLSSLTTTQCAEYRAYLKDLVRREAYSEDSVACIVKVWNSTMRQVFHDHHKPGEGLILKNFRQKGKRFRRLGEADLDALSRALDHIAFRSPFQREALRTYVEVAMCAGPRIGSLVKDDKLEQPGARVGDVNWRDGTLYLRHMKNRMDHEIVLTARAVAQLQRWTKLLEEQGPPIWNGPETVLLTGQTGRPVAAQWVNRKLKEAGASIGWNDLLSTHILRKSVGTLIGARNPKLAQQQLGITEEVHNRYYNSPVLEDRLANRMVLPGATSLDAPAPRPGLPVPSPGDGLSPPGGPVPPDKPPALPGPGVEPGGYA